MIRAALLGYVGIGVLSALAALIFVAPAPSFEGSSGSPGLAAIDSDPAESWSAFNTGTAEQPPAWSGDDFLAVVAQAAGGQIVRMPGSATYLDDQAVQEVIAGTNLLVVVTPPTPLGAVETTRLRDNSAQQAWADTHRLQLIMVHGQEVYLPVGKALQLLIGLTPPVGIPMREGLRTGDATSTVISVAQSARADARGNRDYQAPNPAGSEAYTADQLKLTDTRAPTAAELGPITAALDRGNLYVAPSITPAPSYGTKWAAVGQGKPVKVVLLPYAAPGVAPIEWTGALAARYPADVVLVMTGKWIESAGLDRQTMVDSIISTYDLGGFAISASAPAYTAILDWVTGIDAAAVSSHAFSRPLPGPPARGIPRWLAYLLLGTALIVAVGLAAGNLVERRRARRSPHPREQWRQRVFAALADCYVRVSSTPFLGPGGPELPAGAQQHLDEAYAGLLELRGADVVGDTSTQALVWAVWTDLDAAARAVGEPREGASATLDAALRTAPDLPAVSRSGRGRWRWRPTHSWLLIGLAVAVVAIPLVSLLSRQRPADPDVLALRTSNVAEIGAPNHPAAATLSAIVADRALLIAQVGAGKADDGDQLADRMAKAYPHAVAFVLHNGTIAGASLGADAGTANYDDYSLINYYEDVQNPAGGDVAVARQLALLYDQLGTNGSIHAAVRGAYDPPNVPWVLIAGGLVVAAVLAAFVIRAAVRRAVALAGAVDDERGRRDDLRLRLAAAAPGLVRAASADGVVRAGQIRTLLDRIQTTPDADLDALGERVDALVDRR